MPRDGSGNYNLPSSEPVVTNTIISSVAHNTTMSDLASALTQSIAKDGQTVPTTNLPMGGNRFTNLGTGVAGTDSVNKAQMDSAISAGTAANAILRNGTNAPTANLPMGGFKHTGVLDGTNPQDYASINQTLLRNGANVATNNLPMGGFKHTGVANAVAASDYHTKGQYDSLTFGISQTWADLTASRSIGVIYTNSTTKVRAVSIIVGLASTNSMSFDTPSGSPRATVSITGAALPFSTIFCLIAPGDTYILTGTGTLLAWHEFG